MSANDIRVLLADDHTVVRAGFRRLLEQTPSIHVVAEVSNGDEAYRSYCECEPDVAVMDLSMPGMGGLEAIRRIVARFPSARILVFSMHETAAFAQQSMRAGAWGYVSKASAAEVLVRAVQEVAAGRAYFSPDMAQKIALDSVAGQHDPFSGLTPREFEIFRMLAAGRTIEDIATTLYVSGKTVSNHATQIKQKLGISSPVDMHRLALRYGVVVD